MDFEAARKHMVDSQVRPNDVTDPRIQRAFETVARENFLPAELRAQAYVEREIRYAPERSLLTARDHAKLLDALDIRPGDLVLDVASGAGYSSAILSQLCEMVVAVEDDATLAGKAQENWSAAGLVNTAVVEGPPEAGAPKQGPFDVIVIGGAIEIEPTALLKQLKDGGRLGAIMRKGGVARGVVWRKSGDAIAAHEAFDAAANTVARGFTRPKAFVF
ncbi:MAG: protein-L-isoaspartate O-methyltransferase [Parvularculaceae bacterium]|nr:protein-L-isoaspartate O-methyltransferase [Parvularculaceae bacterium]